ncbi:LysM domain-containing protein [Cryobacterium sp. TMT2-18-3]|uniref:LysM peptidoglycan-binding domain-containing protein n=1 Tax=unclassified Cryobacterium TaxID=2649013 RepID=UPI00106D194A|nr:MULTISPECIES: LysM domain-containing protein [unclassified Cryobacterium]TFC31613.1 LysM domain-containing protein [Cryobacterium sp. TMT2-18-2]TFC33488.1 LysM domain-containing protein [Cryobacterium sp. TMT2-42-4]TFC67724.1 LysM domain-containing protein [Cryobacterium sp. TMT2-18-3]
MNSARPTTTPVRARVALAAMLLFPLGLTGCAGAPAPVVTATVTFTPTPTATPTPTPTPSPEPEAPVVPNPTITPNADAVPVEPLPEGPAVDLGASTGATGAPVTDGAGAPTSYSVLEGDDFFAIAQRFDLPVQQLLRMNPSVSGLGENIYIRDVINLDWTTTG